MVDKERIRYTVETGNGTRHGCPVGGANTTKIDLTAGAPSHANGMGFTSDKRKKLFPTLRSQLLGVAYSLEILLQAGTVQWKNNRRCDDRTGPASTTNFVDARNTLVALTCQCFLE